MYEELTVEEVKNDILSRMSTDIDVREGSFTNDMISGVAYEIWKAYQSLDTMISIAFVDETSGEYIDKRCAEYGITRKGGTKATTTLTVLGVNGTVIPKGKVFLTADGLQYTTNNNAAIENGSVIITATAAEVGEDYNVAAGTITRQFVNSSGIMSVTNTPAAGGTNPETDEALMARLRSYQRRPTTSGNETHYKQWALEVSGCGNAKVFPLWNGPGTVKVLVINEDMAIDPSLPDIVAAHIEAVRPIGAAVTVESPSGLTINIAADVVLDGSKALADVQAAFATALTAYLKGVVFETYSVSYAKIGSLLLSTEGVGDYNDLFVNSGTANISIASDEMPITGTIMLTEVS